MKFTLKSMGLLLVLSGFLSIGLTQRVVTSETYRVAYERGFIDGFDIGKQDSKQKRSFDYSNKNMFQRGNQGMDPSRHDHKIYLVAYRRGFEDGYEDGFEAGKETARSVEPAATSAVEPIDGTELFEVEHSAVGESVTVPLGTEVRIKLLDTLSTQRNEDGDTFRAEVMKNVVAGKTVAIPAGTRLNGRISSARRAGRIKGQAEMNLLFEELQFTDETLVPIYAIVVSVQRRGEKRVKDEEGTLRAEGTKAQDAKNVGISSAIGALIGVFSGGKKGARTGATVGAVGSLAGILSTRGRDLWLYAETELTIRLEREASILTRVLTK